MWADVQEGLEAEGGEGSIHRMKRLVPVSSRKAPGCSEAYTLSFPLLEGTHRGQDLHDSVFTRRTRHLQWRNVPFSFDSSA